jgi:serine/threonine protein kinase/Tol biopolymer transport system component
MTPERWQQVDKLLDRALEHEPARRSAFLDEACRGDSALRREVESLLSAHGKAEGFTEAGPMGKPVKMGIEEPQLLTGRQIGHYQILSRLGEGGMGIVYKARDQHLDRFVAIKVLPPELVADPDRKRRFVQEAKAASALKHPNIITIHDIASDNGTDFIVMEYVDGKTLGQMIPRRGMKLNEVLKYAIQIADGLARAHAVGIIHRDLKPGNIMVGEDGLVKVLDFGLAKLTERPRIGEEESTRSIPPWTDEGTILGTASYMSPEQATGKPVDARSDIFSFGSVLYEMVTGRRAFESDSKMSTLAKIIHEDPDPLSGKIPWDLEKVITRCLRKDIHRRFQHMDDLKVELDELLQSAANPAVAQGLLYQRQRETAELEGPKRRSFILWLVGTLFLLGGMLSAIAYFQRAPAELQSLKLSVLAPENATLDSHAISPDGRRLVFVARSAKESLLWLRSLDSLSAQPLGGTEGAIDPFWSPDGRHLGFFTKDKLKRIALSSGAVTPLCNVWQARGGTWSSNGEILFAPRISDALYRISSVSGGEPVPVTTLDRSRQETHRWPWFLPDGRHFLYFVRSLQRDRNGIYLGSLDSNEKKRLLAGAIGGMAYAAPGYLLYVQNGTLVARPFDPNRLEITGEPFSVVEKVEQRSGWSTTFSVSSADVLTYMRGGHIADTQLVWADRAGKQLQSVAIPPGYDYPRLSPDGTHLAVRGIDPETATGDIWLLELSNGTFRRFTSDPSYEYVPVWSPDGDQIVFFSNAEGPGDLYVKRLSGPDKSEPLLKSSTRKIPEDWSLDGRFILYSNLDSKSNQWDLWALPLFGDRQPIPFLTEPFGEQQGQFSPDGRWVAYCSDESGRDEVYVQSFPGGGNKVPISAAGGRQPRWRRDEKELFFLARDGTIMVSDVKAGPTLRAGIPKVLPLKVLSSSDDVSYAVTADGQRFLFRKPFGEPEPASITVITNWTTGLKR